jgi:hypothetical protein
LSGRARRNAAQRGEELRKAAIAAEEVDRKPQAQGKRSAPQQFAADIDGASCGAICGCFRASAAKRCGGNRNGATKWLESRNRFLPCSLTRLFSGLQAATRATRRRLTAGGDAARR